MAHFYSDVCSIYSDGDKPAEDKSKIVEPPKTSKKNDLDYSHYCSDVCSQYSDDDKIEEKITKELEATKATKTVDLDYGHYCPDVCSQYSDDHKIKEKVTEAPKAIKSVELDYAHYSPDACSIYSDEKPKEKPKEPPKPAVDFDYSHYSPDACSIYSDEKPKEKPKAVIDFDYSQYSPDACSIYSEDKPPEKPKESPKIDFDFSQYNPDACSVYSDEVKPEPAASVTHSSVSDDKGTPVSMLVTGFGLRNLESLQRALLDDEQRRQMLLAQHDIGESFECEDLPLSESSKLEESVASKSSVTLQQPVTTRRSLSLEYLMGLAQEQQTYEEYTEKEEKIPKLKIPIEKVDSRITTAMRQARQYLHDHKIFQFFQFLMAHMCAEVPENPIEFLLDLLDRCLLYRSGFGQPPLLFEKKHIEQLFKMMDPMKTGFIEMKQYESGMKTLGICNYDKHPPLSTDGLIAKDFFIEEAYECLTDLFVDMVRHRNIGSTPSLMTPPPTVAAPSLASYGYGQ